MKISRVILVSLAVLVAGVLWFVFLAGSTDYSDADIREVNRAELFAITEQLLAESESWPPELEADQVSVSSSLEPYPVRTVRYSVEVEADFEEVVEYIKDENYSGPGRRDKPEKSKYEVTLYQKDVEGVPNEWVRRSVHIAPPPGGNRDAVVVYYEDRPDPNTYRVAFQSIETIDGKDVPVVEDAVRFKVLPSIYKVEQTAPGKVRVRKIEAVDPRGSMSTAMNNYFISLLFFRDYMFEQAKDMRRTLGSGSQG
ncbi:MAG: hypothetical protein CBC48_03535 [bacterium TMED88]|nr:hypothetical protein [Deltaproteobacteria bacterium]OUV35649.1 MAG: hypothetical protein CBC48_03535 [bacterium TMED88]